MNVSVIVPVKNEAENVATLVHEIQDVLAAQRDLDYEILFVDDGSSDRTPDILQELAAALTSLRILQHNSNCGQSTAVLTGVLHAIHDYIVVLDGDGQNNPADIPDLIRLFAAARPEDKLGMVIGNRVNRQDSIIRKISSRIANSVRASLLNDSTPDSGCGLKILPRSLFLRLPFFDHMHRFMPALVIRQGLKVQSIPITHRQRMAGTSKYGIHNRLWVGIVDLFGAMWLIRRMQRPTVKELSGDLRSRQPGSQRKA
jgi:dolichol-phosphate mannosyltransferase